MPICRIVSSGRTTLLVVEGGLVLNVRNPEDTSLAMAFTFHMNVHRTSYFGVFSKHTHMSTSRKNASDRLANVNTHDHSALSTDCPSSSAAANNIQPHKCQGSFEPLVETILRNAP